MQSRLSAIPASCWRNLFVLELAWALTTAAAAADRILFDFAAEADITQIITTDAKVSAAKPGIGSALRVGTRRHRIKLYRRAGWRTAVTLRLCQLYL